MLDICPDFSNGNQVVLVAIWRSVTVESLIREHKPPIQGNSCVHHNVSKILSWPKANSLWEGDKLHGQPVGIFHLWSYVRKADWTFSLSSNYARVGIVGIGICTQFIYIYTFLQNDACVEVKMAFKKRKRGKLKYPEGTQLKTFCVYCKTRIMSLCQGFE